MGRDARHPTVVGRELRPAQSAQVARTLRAYENLFAGRTSGAELWRELKLLNQIGVTRGQLEATPQVIFKKR